MLLSFTSYYELMFFSLLSIHFKGSHGTGFAWGCVLVMYELIWVPLCAIKRLLLGGVCGVGRRVPSCVILGGWIPYIIGFILGVVLRGVKWVLVILLDVRLSFVRGGGVGGVGWVVWCVGCFIICGSYCAGSIGVCFGVSPGGRLTLLICGVYLRVYVSLPRGGMTVYVGSRVVWLFWCVYIVGGLMGLCTTCSRRVGLFSGRGSAGGFGGVVFRLIVFPLAYVLLWVVLGICGWV